VNASEQQKNVSSSLINRLKLRIYMKVYEIVREERLDEIGPAAIPIIGGLTWAGVVGAVSLFLTTISVIDIYKILEKNNYDLASMSDEDWKDVFLDLIMLSVPGAGNFTKSAIRKLIPDSWLLSAANKARLQILSRARAGTAAANPARLSRLKKLADARYAKIASNVKNVLVTAGLASVVATYFYKLEDLEDQYEAAKSGDTTTELFGNASQSELVGLADRQRTRLLGELTLSIAGILGALTGAAAIKTLTSLFGSVKGGSVVGGLLSIPAAGLSKLATIGAAAWPILLHTQAGQEFLSNNIVRMITGGTGATVSWGIEKLYQAIEEVSKRVGLDATGVTGAMRSTIATDKAATPNRIQQAMASKIPYTLRLEKDNANPNILYIGGVQVTDKDGFQSVGNSYKQMLSKQAVASNVPDPTTGLKPKPGVNYNY
jgi:hypothetical protein